MTDFLDDTDTAATPLTPDERNGLIPSYITTRRELNEAEQRNILKAQLWAFQRPREILSVDFLRTLHKRMFCDVWSWAGIFRKTERNLGIEARSIASEMKRLVDDAIVQIEHASYATDEIACRFHHRLVFVHPFANGNGRFSRLAADLLIRQLGGECFSWGTDDLSTRNSNRAAYISALRQADQHDFSALLRFMR